MHLPTMKKTLSFLQEIIARNRKNDIQNILLSQTIDKYTVVKRTPIVGYYSRSSRPEMLKS